MVAPGPWRTTRTRAHAADPAQHPRGRARGRGRPLRDPDLSL